MKTFTKSNVSKGELELYKVLSVIAQRYNNAFSVLQLPYAIEIDEANQKLTLPYYEGQTFNEAWDESNGGLPLKLDLSREVPLLLKDLCTIEIDQLTLQKELTEMPKVTFDHTEVLEHYSALATKLCDDQLLSPKDLSHIKGLLSYKQKSEIIFNNGDFYPRNLIRQKDGKLVLIDWEVWNPHSPFYILDHIENVAAVIYVHMWGNKPWQKAYIEELKHHFSFTDESWQKAVIMKALELAELWYGKDKDNLVSYQIDTIHHTPEQAG